MYLKRNLQCKTYILQHQFTIKIYVFVCDVQVVLKSLGGGLVVVEKGGGGGVNGTCDGSYCSNKSCKTDVAYYHCISFQPTPPIPCLPLKMVVTLCSTEQTTRSTAQRKEMY